MHSEHLRAFPLDRAFPGVFSLRGYIYPSKLRLCT